MNFKDKLTKELEKQLKQEVNLRPTPSPEFGDYALFLKNPNKKIKSNLIKKTEVKGNYLNIFINKTKFIEETLKDINKDYGKSKENKTILIESPGPNTNKPLHIGHLRNMALGISLSNMLNYLGNKIINVDIINDRGIHICKSMLAYKLYGKNQQPNKKPDHFVGDYYVLYSQKNIPDERAQEMLIKWEKGDKETIALWKKMNKWAIEGMHQTYKEFGLNIKKTYYESQHYSKGKDIVLKGLQEGLFQKDKEGIIINLGKELGKKVLLRSDGTSIYITQDIYLAKQRYEDFKFNKMIYIVGSEQIYHFKALFEIFKRLKYNFADNCYHLSYGMVSLPEGKMKSREGKVVDADDMIENTKELAIKKIKQRDKLPKKETLEISKEIGLAAIKFFLLKYDSKKDFIFNPEEALSFEGETGPYIQYTHARISSILKKSKSNIEIDYQKYNQQEFQLIKKLSEFPEIIKDSAIKYKPNLLCNYLIQLSQLFNTYYSKYEIKNSKERLLLISKIKQILTIGLNLLGIQAPEAM